MPDNFARQFVRGIGPSNPAIVGLPEVSRPPLFPRITAPASHGSSPPPLCRHSTVGSALLLPSPYWILPLPQHKLKVQCSEPCAFSRVVGCRFGCTAHRGQWLWANSECAHVQDVPPFWGYSFGNMLKIKAENEIYFLTYFGIYSFHILKLHMFLNF